MTYKAPFPQQGDGIGLTKPEPSRKHFFRDEQDNRAEVETSLLSTGQYRAELIETTGGALELLNLCGYGYSRLAAIADLQQWIEEQGE